jgi:hypothetical protein
MRLSDVAAPYNDGTIYHCLSYVWLGSGPCSGDSGGGMYTPERMENGATRWMLRGVVSQSLLDETTHQCDLRNYVVFTDVAKHVTWIRQIIETT